MKCVFELSEIVSGLQISKTHPFSVGFIRSSCRRKRQDGDRSRVDVSVRLLGATKGKYGGFLGFSQPQQRKSPRAINRKQHRIQRAEKGCRVRGFDSAPGVADLTMHHGKGVMSRSI